MTGFSEPDDCEERWVLRGFEHAYYIDLFPYAFSVDGRHVPNGYLTDAHEWCGSHWGASAARRWSQTHNRWRVRNDSTWAYFRNTFYFKDPDHCVLFQLRWR